MPTWQELVGGRKVSSFQVSFFRGMLTRPVAQGCSPAAASPAGRPASLAAWRAESGEPVDLPAGSYTGGVTDLTTAGADKAAADIPAVAFT